MIHRFLQCESPIQHVAGSALTRSSNAHPPTIALAVFASLLGITGSHAQSATEQNLKAEREAQAMAYEGVAHLLPNRATSAGMQRFSPRKAAPPPPKP